MRGLIVEILQWIADSSCLIFQEGTTGDHIKLHHLVMRTTMVKGAGLILEGRDFLFIDLKMRWESVILPSGKEDNRQ